MESPLRRVRLAHRRQAQGRGSFGTVSELAELALLVAQGAGFPSQKHQSGSTG